MKPSKKIKQLDTIKDKKKIKRILKEISSKLGEGKKL
ncbi:hypothetical protein SAMN05216231_3725 [Virgibacillus salinus]|uniref:Uncharacterized protein n=1 Tax=Virgibacillus salinus TaxID=553311 RepID=A0A1H1GH92_9BACI|nr:hypothetical protein SAMN05216231_3725 [Virgibacillus salinus]